MMLTNVALIALFLLGVLAAIVNRTVPLLLLIAAVVIVYHVARMLSED